MQVCMELRVGSRAEMENTVIENLQGVAAEVGWTTDRLLDHLQPYEPVAVRGTGGFAVLLDARRGSDSVVVKLPRSLNEPFGLSFEDAVANLQYEGSFLVRAGPTSNLVGLVEFRQHGDLPFLALESLGRSLDAVIPEDGLDLRRCLEVVHACVCCAACRNMLSRPRSFASTLVTWRTMTSSR